MAAWPGTLPALPDQDTYIEKVPNLLIRSSMDIGPAKIRKRMTANTREHTVTLQLDATQLAAFDTFFITDCSAGAIPFTWVRARDGAAKTFRFGEQLPEYRNIGSTIWSVSFTMEELP